MGSSASLSESASAPPGVRQALEEQGNTGEFLANALVKAAAKAPALALRDTQNLAFERALLGHVAQRQHDSFEQRVRTLIAGENVQRLRPRGTLEVHLEPGLEGALAR